MPITKKYIILMIVVSLGIGVLVFYKFSVFEYKGFEKALEGILLLSSICLGFYGACLGILASIFNTKIVKEVMTDKNYRNEFILISILALVSGFLIVMTTILYQVLLANGEVALIFLRLINSFWFGLLILFLSFSVLFVLVSFFIFFANKDNEEEVDQGEITNPNF